MRTFAELNAVVTGANRDDGIGLAVVRALASRGAAKIVGTYRNAASAAALLDLSARDPHVLATALDVTSDASVAAFGTWCGRELGRVDLLINNAGLGDASGNVVIAPLEELAAQVETHGIGMLRVSRVMLPLMKRGAVILNVSSTLGSIATMDERWAFYSPAKAFQNALTRQLAATVRRDGIVVFAVCPGWVATSMGGRGAPLQPAKAALDLLTLATQATMADTGTFRDHDGSTVPW